MDGTGLRDIVLSTDEETEAQRERGNFWKDQVSKWSSRDETSFVLFLVICPFLVLMLPLGVGFLWGWLLPCGRWGLSDAKRLEFLSQIPPPPKKLQSFSHSFFGE